MLRASMAPCCDFLKLHQSYSICPALHPFFPTDADPESPTSETRMYKSNLRFYFLGNPARIMDEETKRLYK